MHFRVLLFALPTAWAALAYNPPMALLAQAADANSDCKLPNDYHVKNFQSESQNAGQNLSAFDFTFYDDTTKITTPCYFNSTSESTGAPGRTPRYPCENSSVEFIWEDDDKKLWMIQKVCPGPDGAADFEASGSVVIPVKCSSNSDQCTTNSTDYRSLFTSIAPIRDSTAL